MKQVFTFFVLRGISELIKKMRCFTKSNSQRKVNDNSAVEELRCKKNNDGVALCTGRDCVRGKLTHLGMREHSICLLT